MPEGAIAGWLQGKEHRLALRVYYADTDAGGVVYHAAYLSFAERARTEMMRLIGVDLLALKDEKHVVFSVRRCAIDFFRPARLDDLIEVRTTLRHIGGASLEVDQTFWRDETELVSLHIKLACTRLPFKAVRIPEDERRIMQDYVKETD